MTMEAQALLRFTPLSVSLKHKNSLTIVVVKAPPLITKEHHRVLAFHSIATAPTREKDSKKRVVITGMGVVSVLGNDVDMFYDRLLAGENGITLIDKFDTSNLPTTFGGQIRDFESNMYIVGKDDQRVVDDSHRYCIFAGRKALENAGLGVCERSKIDKERAGVLIGTGFGGLSSYADNVESFIESGCRKRKYFFSPYVNSTAPALLAIDLGFMGPNYAIAAACATSNYCLCAAANHIREGEADLMIAGGVEASIVPFGVASLAATTAVSKRNHDHQTASRPWDKDRDGFVIGEGAGVLVMESLEHAMRRDAPILAEYLGGAANCDAYHITSPRPDGFGVSSCIRCSLLDAGVSVEEVNYINAHATSTVAGDVAEAKAINNVFKNTKELKVNATKSIIGHCLAAAGSIEAIATIKAIQTGWLHPTINQFNLEPVVKFDTVAITKQQHEINVAISNSFGFGGHNSVVAFSAFKP